MKESVCVPDLNYVKITYADTQHERRKLGEKVFSLIVKIYFYSILKKKKVCYQNVHCIPTIMKSNHDKIRMLLVDNSALNMEYKNGQNRFCLLHLP